jgi:hypothetical protein
MSALWNAKATVPDFNPPFYERTDLGTDEQESKLEPEPEQKSLAIRRFKLRACRHNMRARNYNQPKLPKNSWSTISTESESEIASESMVFKRAPIKPVTTTSLLTMSMRPSPKEAPEENINAASFFTKVMGKEVVSVDMLPSAFDSDSEDEFDTPQEAPRKNINPAGFFARVMGKEVVSVDMLPSAFDSDSEDEFDGLVIRMK